MYYINQNIKNIYRMKETQSRKNYLRLDMNENPEGLPEEFIWEILKNITPEFLATYPESGLLTSRIALVNKLQENQICLTNGSDEAIRFIFEVFTKSGNNIVSVSPTFAMYSVYCNMFGVENKVVKYDSRLNVNINDIIQLIDDKTNLIILLNPNNPIGNTYTEWEVRKIIAAAAEKNALVIIDEAYHYFYSNTFINLINEYENLLLIRTFSKLFSIAALRLGYAAGNKELIEYINNVSPSYNVNSVALLFGEAIIKNKKMEEELISIEKEGKEYFIEQLKIYKYEIIVKEGNYVFIKTQKLVSEVAQLLKERKILVKTYKETLLKDYIRVSIGSKKVMKQFCEIFFEEDSGKEREGGNEVK